MQKRKSKKSAVFAVAIAACLAAAAGGVYMWLTDTTDAVENVFTIGNVDITLTETEGEMKTGDTNHYFKMVPGKEIAKDPLVTVKADSEKCYVFVKIEEAGGDVTVGSKAYAFSDWLTYSAASGWTALGSSYPGVYYRVVDTSTSDQTFYALADANTSTTSVGANGSVLVDEGVTQEMMDALAADTTKYPNLTFTAYAVQFEGMSDAADAWSKL